MRVWVVIVYCKNSIIFLCVTFELLSARVIAISMTQLAFAADPTTRGTYNTHGVHNNLQKPGSQLSLYHVSTVTNNGFCI